MAYIPGRIPASNLVQIPGRIPANLNISLQIPQGVHTDSCRNLYKKNKSVHMIPARNLVSISCGNTAVFLLDNFVQEVGLDWFENHVLLCVGSTLGTLKIICVTENVISKSIHILQL